jgi:hypothetical protein
MQAEINGTNPPRPVYILGINEAGQEAGNTSFFYSGRTLPWMQDTVQQNVWGNWHVTWRDVVVLDKLNQPVLVYNLTVHDLGNPVNYAELKNALLGFAAAP